MSSNNGVHPELGLGEREQTMMIKEAKTNYRDGSTTPTRIANPGPAYVLLSRIITAYDTF